MYYYCAKMSAFKLPELVQYTPAGGIIAASAVTCGTLQRRSFMPHPHLVHRMLDPQLYLATLDPMTAPNTIFKLGTYSWFGVKAPEYDSDVHGTHADYKTTHQQKILSGWPGSAPNTKNDIAKAVRECLEFQLSLGCETLIGPSPLTIQQGSYTTETLYLDALSEAVQDLQIKVPTFATVAISDSLLRIEDPSENKLIELIAAQISARPEIAGIYVVVEQTAETGYICNSVEVLSNLLVLIDDVVRGAGKRAVVNYMGSFGPVITAVGAQVWSSGFYRSQRRMRLVDQIESEGRAYPRFYSLALAGDVGVEKDIPVVYDSPIFNTVFTKTQASRPLAKALKAGTTSPEWQYKIGNIWPAAAHYNDVSSKVDAYLDSMSAIEKVQAVDDWLDRACAVARTVSKLDIDPNKTDVRHQKVWLAAYQKWRAYSGV